ncbi:hypothetical protein IPM09_05320 [Candidatus Saccharibacteria bacterium]|nr:MAG: hypothetical protein IPM09_05320 [Candidatus Saccharibacteria bacterium]
MSEEPKQADGSAAPAPELLTTQDTGDAKFATPEQSMAAHVDHAPATAVKRRIAYRPSHKATFIGLAVVALILGLNAVILSVVMKNNADAQDAKVKNGVTISASTLDKLGVSRNPVGNAETELVVGPNSTFNGKVVMGGDLSVAGVLQLNNKFTASDASLAKLQAGDVQLEKLNVNGDGTVSTLNLRKDLQVAGTTRLQGPLTVNQLTTINNNLNVAGNLAIGGTLSVRNFQVSNLTVAGHLISSGGKPGVSVGGGAGSNGTVSLDGNDTSGTVAVNTGVGAGSGLLATITFAERFASTPRVVVTPIGRAVPGLYINRTSTGFTISADGALAPGGYAFDYVVVQ